MALQFHLETTPSSAREIVFNSREELLSSAADEYVQQEEEMLAVSEYRYRLINQQMDRVLSIFFE